jgi:hypothetical protein
MARRNRKLGRIPGPVNQTSWSRNPSTIVGLESDTYELIGLPAKEWDVLDDAIGWLRTRGKNVT